MKQRLSRYYCQYSGIIMGFALVFVFLFGLRSFSLWEAFLPSPYPFLCTLLASVLFSVAAYFTLDRLRMLFFKHLPATSQTCSTTIQKS